MIDDEEIAIENADTDHGAAGHAGHEGVVVPSSR